MAEPVSEKKKGVVREFKEFINRGNVIDLAVAFVLGLAFAAVVAAFAGDKDNPGIVGGILGAIFGGDQPDFSAKGITVNGSFIPIGAFINTIVNFLLVALVLFFIIKVYNKFRKTEGGQTTNEILSDIREELRKQNNAA
jgi:large conductance mechanosensitive channel